MENIGIKLTDILDRGIKEGVFSGAAAGIIFLKEGRRHKLCLYRGRVSADPLAEQVNESAFFDLASLTKPLATTLSVMALISDHKISLEAPLEELLERVVPEDKQGIRLHDILCHQAGFAAHRPFYEILRRYEFGMREGLLEEMILSEPLVHQPGTASEYSDLGFMLLGIMVKRKTGKDLATFFSRKITAPLGIGNAIFFRPIGMEGCLKEQGSELFVATERCRWREKILCGEVHDDNCHVLGGVSGHSGLFGNLEGVLQLTDGLLDIWKGRGFHPAFEKKILDNFFRRRRNIPGNTRTLGFDTPSPEGSSSGGYLSPESVGHLGFTGTSFWIDPVREMTIILLTNRVHPDRDNWKLKEFRPEFHDMVVLEMKKKGCI